MKAMNRYYQEQLKAIHNLYNDLSRRSKQKLSLEQVVLTWFAEGYAEKFREAYFKKQPH